MNPGPTLDGVVVRFVTWRGYAIDTYSGSLFMLLMVLMVSMDDDGADG